MQISKRFYLLIMSIATSLLAAMPAHAHPAYKVIQNSITKLLQQPITKKRVLQLGATGLATYALAKASPHIYRKYTDWKHNRAANRRALAAQSLADAAHILRERKREAQLEEQFEAWVKQQPQHQPAATPVITSAQQRTPDKLWPAVSQSTADQEKIKKHKQLEAALHEQRNTKTIDPNAQYATYAGLAPITPPATQAQPAAAITLPPARLDAPEEPQEAKVHVAEQMVVPLDGEQQAIFDFYNRGMGYVHFIYDGQAALVPQATPAEFEESLRSIMWFLYMTSTTKADCHFEEGTMTILDHQNKLYNFLRSNNFAQPRISTHFKEYETKSDNGDSKRQAEAGKCDYGIDVTGLPTGKQHVLFGKLKEELLYIKLENYGLGLTGIVPHGWEAFVAYVRKVKWIREKTAMVSDDHETFRKERVPEDISAAALAHLQTLGQAELLTASEVAMLTKKFKDFGILCIVPFFEFYADTNPALRTWLETIKTQYPDWRNRKGREVVLSHEELLAAPFKDPRMHVIVTEE